MQIPPLFGGFDLCDTGFYLTFYDNVFSAPGTVEYNFMYYLSGVVGGTLLKIFPESFFSLRLLTLFCNLMCIWALWRMKPEFKGADLTLTAGVIMLLAGVWFVPITFYYDTLTALLVCVSMSFLWRGLHSANKMHFFFIAGLLTGLNLFSRVTNVLDLSFIFLIPICSQVLDGKARWRPCLPFGAGWLCGIAAVLLLMTVLGHLNVFMSNMSDLFGIAASRGTEASHGAGNLVKAQVLAWLKFIPLMWKLVLIALVSALANSLSAEWSWLRRAADAVLLAAAMFLIWKIDTSGALFALFYSLTLAGVFFARSSQLRALCWIGLITMLVLPLGSDHGVYNMGVYALWLGAVPAVSVMVEGTKCIGRCGFRASPIAVVLLAGCIVVSAVSRICRNGFYFDSTPLSELTCEIDSRRARMVYTSSERARRVDEMLKALDVYVNPGDTLLVYGSAPTLNWLTSTRPALGNSWPEQLSPGTLLSKLAESEPIRYVALIKFNTIGSEWGSPSQSYVEGRVFSNIYHNERKSRIVLDYLRTRGYKTLVDTTDLTLYKLAEKPDPCE